jgi:hypothetical protein
MFSYAKPFFVFMALFFSALPFSSAKTPSFGETIQDLLTSKEFSSHSQGKILVTKAKIGSILDNKATHCFTKTNYLHISSNQKYSSFHTTEDECDGGNSFGWIENSLGLKVANISDSFIYPYTLSFTDIEFTFEGEAKSEKKSLEALKKHIFSQRGDWNSLYGYTFVMLEGNGITKDLSEENVLNIMLSYLKSSTVKLLKKVSGFNVGHKKLYQIRYNMDGFIAFVYYTVELETEKVEFIQIDD